MGSHLKILNPQSARPSGETAALAASLLDFSSAATMNDIRRFSQFLPVVVFVPKRAVEGRDRSQAIGADELTGHATEEAIGQLNIALAHPENAKPVEAAFGAVTINFLEMTAFRENQPVELTAMEFKALKYFIQNAKRVISREELLNEVWGYENYPSTRTVDNHILKLRRKLEEKPSEPRHFITVHRTGYKFMP